MNYDTLVNFIEAFLRDARFAARVLRKSPGFTLIAVCTLALVICANAVVFSVLNALVLRPLKLPREESLYELLRESSNKAENQSYQSYPDYLDLRDRNRSFDGLVALNVVAAGLNKGTGPVEVYGYEVSGNYFDELGIQPYIGRFLHSSDEHGPNSAPYMVLSYAYWHSDFQDDREVIGRVVLLNSHPFTIIGVAPPGFLGTISNFDSDFFVPLVDQEQVEGESTLEARGKRPILMAIGHLKAGVTPAQAVADLNSVGSYLAETYPKEDGHMRFSLERTNDLGTGGRAFMVVLMVLAGLLLLAACANLGSLFAARGAERTREVALRLALGAKRKFIAWQVFTEAMLISLAGGAAGLLVSILLLHKLTAWRPVPQLPNLHLDVNPDPRVYWIVLLLAVVSGFLFGAVPVQQLLRTQEYEIIKAGPSRGAGRSITVRDVLLAVQIAICALLVTSSLVAARGLAHSLRGNFGFEPRNAMLVNTVLSMGGYSGNRVPDMQKRMISALEPVPGVASVAVVDLLPLSAAFVRSSVFTDTTTDLSSQNAAANPYKYSISPEYFRTARTALLAGRSFSPHDGKDSLPVAIVNRELARILFGSVSNAMGRYYKLQDGTRVQVVGVVEDGKYRSLTESQEPAMFLPFEQSPSLGTWTTVIVRFDRDPQQLVSAIRGTVRNLDAGLPFNIKTWTEEMDTALFFPRLITMVLSVLGGMGAMLSITGIFGLASYSVSMRLRDLGIRMALGAQSNQILRTALGRALRLLAFGSVVGLLLGILTSTVLAHVVYHATARDPVVLGGVVITMLLFGLLATWIPAQRALSFNPSVLLRGQ